MRADVEAQVTLADERRVDLRQRPVVKRHPGAIEKGGSKANYFLAGAEETLHGMNHSGSIEKCRG